MTAETRDTHSAFKKGPLVTIKYDLKANGDTDDETDDYDCCTSRGSETNDLTVESEASDSKMQACILDELNMNMAFNSQSLVRFSYDNFGQDYEAEKMLGSGIAIFS